MAIEHDICVIILNGTVSAAYPPHPQRHPHPNREAPISPPSSTSSLFASWTNQKPALGQTFPYCIDTHVLLSRVPSDMVRAVIRRRAGDEDSKKRVAPSRSRGMMDGDIRAGEEEVTVCEVLADRHGGREGRWACFETVSLVVTRPLDIHEDVDNDCEGDRRAFNFATSISHRRSRIAGTWRLRRRGARDPSCGNTALRTMTRCPKRTMICR